MQEGIERVVWVTAMYFLLVYMCTTYLQSTCLPQVLRVPMNGLRVPRLRVPRLRDLCPLRCVRCPWGAVYLLSLACGG